MAKQFSSIEEIWRELLALQQRQYKNALINTFLTGGAFIIALIAFLIAILK